MLKESCFEFGIIKDYPTIGKDKKGFKEWYRKLKKNLKSVLGTDHPVHTWMDAIEKAY